MCRTNPISPARQCCSASLQRPSHTFMLDRYHPNLLEDGIEADALAANNATLPPRCQPGGLRILCLAFAPPHLIINLHSKRQIPCFGVCSSKSHSGSNPFANNLLGLPSNKPAGNNGCKAFTKVLCAIVRIQCGYKAPANNQYHFCIIVPFSSHTNCPLLGCKENSHSLSP